MVSGRPETTHCEGLAGPRPCVAGQRDCRLFQISLNSLLEIDFLIERRDQTVDGPRRPDEQELGNATSKSWVTHGRVEARGPYIASLVKKLELEAVTMQLRGSIRGNSEEINFAGPFILIV